jgi:hypothetical protein
MAGTKMRGLRKMLLKNLCPVQEEPERSEDLSDDIPKPERSLAPTATI